MDGAVVCDLEYATHLAENRIEILAWGGTRTDKAVKGSEDHLVEINELIGESELMREVRQNIVIAVSLDLSVLITGEPGTGKEHVARHTQRQYLKREAFRVHQLHGVQSEFDRE